MIRKFIGITVVSATLLFTGCAPSANEVAKTAWFKDYKTFDKQIKELKLKELKKDIYFFFLNHFEM